jgi:tetratricopeptide (TPR) repeat protein
MLEALVRDYPNFALAHTRLAEVYAYTSAETLGLPGFDTEAAAQEHLRVARRISGETADTALISAFLAFIASEDFNTASGFATRATSIEPNRSDAWQMLALIQSVGGRHDDALRSILRAQELDPASLDIRWDHVFFLYAAERYEEALREAEVSARLTAMYPLYVALIYDALGRPHDAFEQWLDRARRRGLSEAQTQAAQRAAQERGVMAGYRAIADGLSGAYRESGVPLAVLLINAGDSNGAVNALIEPPDSRDRWLTPFVDRIVNLRPIRHDPRLAQMFDRITEFRG